MSELNYFKVLTATHNEGGKDYAKGKVVPTSRDLAAMFGSHKFRPCTKSGKPLSIEVEEEEVTDLDDAEDDAEKSTSKKSSKSAKKGKADGDALDNASTSDDDASSKASDYEKIESELGDDVTMDMESGTRIAEADLAVLKKGREYFVVDRDMPANSLSGDKKLNSKKAAEEFVNAYLK